MATPNFTELAGRATDPRFYAALAILPNPDPILRRAGISEDVFDSIQSDAHVMGELRMVRADLLRFDHRLVPPKNPNRAERKATELCESFFARPPAPMANWLDTRWQIGQAPFRGQAVHEMVFDRFGDYILPAKLLDRPNRRFRYGAMGELRLLTRQDMLYGTPAEEQYFLVNRHWASYDNPYGIALFSSCFWPYTFKHAGFRWFVKFCERHGLPWPVGKYPPGTLEPEIARFEEALAAMVEAGYLAIQDGGSVELHEAKGSSGGGKLAQHLLIEAANAEMSKALSSQTLSTESPNNGSRAASETHRERAADVNEGDREAIAYTLDTLCALIVRINFGEDVRPPTNEFSADSQATKERAEIYEVFERTYGGGSRKAAAAELGIELAEDDADRAQPTQSTPQRDPVAQAAAEFARDTSSDFADQDAIDAVDLDAQLQGIASDLLKPLFRRVAKGVPPEELLADLANLYPLLDDEKLQELLARVLFLGEVWGRLSANNEAD